MKYAIFSPLYAPHVGGVENFTKNLSAALARKGNSILVVTMNIDSLPLQETEISGVNVIRLPCYALMDGRLPWPHKNAEYNLLLEKALAWGADRVLVNTRFYPLSIAGLEYARAINAPAVMLDHGSAYLTLGSSLADVSIKCYEHVVTKRAKSYEPTFAGISEKSATWLKTFGIATDIVIPNAINAADFRAQSSSRDFRAELGIASEDSIVVFVGRLEPEKGCLALVDAAVAFRDEQVDFVLAGDGSLRSEIARKAGGNVYLLGNVDRGDLASLLLESDLFCLPTRSEGFCTSLLEASACGLPAVITDVGGAHELIPSDDFGLIIKEATPFSIEAAIREMLSRGNQGLQNAGDLCRNLVERHFTWDSSVCALEQAFE